LDFEVGFPKKGLFKFETGYEIGLQRRFFTEKKRKKAETNERKFEREAKRLKRQRRGKDEEKIKEESNIGSELNWWKITPL
jgi:hypothetical protein